MTSFLSIPSFLGKPPTITATLTPVHPSTASVVATTPDKTRSSARYISHFANIHIKKCLGNCSAIFLCLTFLLKLQNSFSNKFNIHSFKKKMFKQTCVSETEATFEKRESSIDQLHLDTVESFSSKGNIQHVEDHWLVSTKHDTPCNHRDKSVSNLSCNQIKTILSLINHKTISLITTKTVSNS